MRTLKSLAAAASLAAAIVLIGCGTAPPHSGALAQGDAVLRQANPQLAVALTVTPPQVRVGETIGLQVGSVAPGYLYVYQIGTDAKSLSVVFPNAMDGANFLTGGTASTDLPRAGWRLSARGPGGVGYFVAVVAQKQQDLTRLAADVSAGRIAIDGAYGAAMATLREVAP